MIIALLLNPKGVNMGNNLNFLTDAVDQPIQSKGNTLDFLQTSEEKPTPSMKDKILKTIQSYFTEEDNTVEALGSPVQDEPLSIDSTPPSKLNTSVEIEPPSVELTSAPKPKPLVEKPKQPVPEKLPSFEDVSKKLVSDLMRDFDLSKLQAVALAGNLAYESTNFQTMQEVLSGERKKKGHKGGLGYVQWTDTSSKNNRRTKFEEFASKNNLSISSYDANYGYLKKELSERMPGTLENMGKNMIKKLKKANDLEEAVKIVMAGYLRPRAYIKRKTNPSAYNSLVNKRADRAKQIQGLL